MPLVVSVQWFCIVWSDDGGVPYLTNNPPQKKKMLNVWNGEIFYFESFELHQGLKFAVQYL